MSEQPIPPEGDEGQQPRLMERIRAHLDGSGLTFDPEADELPEPVLALLRDRETQLMEARRHMRTLYPEHASLTSPTPTTGTTPTPPPPPPARWISIGPAVITRGQAHTRPPVAGRTVGIALAPSHQRVYLGTANGGVWRSDDDGRTWRSMMEAWDLNPTTNHSDTLTCGAIAVDPTNPDRVWVGTGEPGPKLHCFWGIGPVHSRDGGRSWAVEPAPAVLRGQTFYGLAVDPGNPETVVGASTAGLFCREIHAGAVRWILVRPGMHTSVVVARSNDITAFYAAESNGQIHTSADGKNWTQLGGSFTTGRYITLACRPDYRSVVYALVANNAFVGLMRYDALVDTTWRQVNGVTNPIPRNTGFWNLSMAVDPRNTHTLYLGGDTYDRDPAPNRSSWVAMLRRVRVSKRTSGTTTTWHATDRQIGDTVHPDIQVLVTDPTDRNRLWVGCDGGVFRTTNAREAAPVFEARNTGLATAMLNNLGHHPTQDAVVFCGTQDNGGIRSLGSEVWSHVLGGDSGCMVVDWNNNYRVAATYTRNSVYRATDGANDTNSWRVDPSDNGRVPVARQLFYSPLVNTPRNTANTGEADRIAFGGDQVAISDNFGFPPWTRLGTSLPGPEVYASLAFASHRRIYAGGTGGTVRRYDQPVGGGAWTETALPAGLPAGRVSDIAVDPTNADRIWVCLAGWPTLAGTHSTHRVWYYDGTAWHARSSGLLDVDHNALAIDPNNANNVYVGTDIGVWRTTNATTATPTWAPWSLGLPDASVLDLKIHAPSRMIRVSTHGRSAWERSLDATEGRNVELWVRDTILDTGRVATPTGAADPTNRGGTLDPGNSPDIKVDVPSAAGTFQTRTTNIDILEFDQSITDRKDRVGTVTAARGTLKNRVFVQVRSRGVRPADNVRVMLLVAERTGGNPPQLPAGYDAHVRAGTDISGGGWSTVGKRPLVGIKDGHSRIAGFELPSTHFPRPDALSGHKRWCLLALVHHDDDPFNATERDVATLSRNERKAALKHIEVTRFTGTMPLVPTAAAWYRIQPATANWPLTADPPEFRIFGEESGRATVELAWDPQALLSPSGDYRGNEVLRYYSSAEPFDKTVRKADGTDLRVQVPVQHIRLTANRTTWTIPEALWEGYKAEAAKGTEAFSFQLYYRVRVQPTASPEAIAWPSDQVIQDNPDAPHLGLLTVPATAPTEFPDAEALAAADPDARAHVTSLWGRPPTEPERQCLVRLLAHVGYTAMNPSQRGDVLELFAATVGPSQAKVDDLLERQVWRSRSETRPALLSVDRRGGPTGSQTDRKTLTERLLELRDITPHPDLVGVANNAQLVDDVITEVLDPNGQMNQGDTGMGPISAVQALLIHVAPAEYVRLLCGLLSTEGRATLANGDTVSVPPGVFQYTRYGSSQASGFHVRTNSELAFHAALLAYGQGSRFPDYDPSADASSDTGVVQAFRAVVRGGLTKDEMNRVASGLFAVPFTASNDGPSATVRNAFTTALDRRLQPLLLALRWSPRASTPGARGHAVLAMRRHEGRVVFKNTEYAGSSPPSGVTAGAQLTAPPRRVEDPTQGLESISEADLDNEIMWFHEPQQDLLS